MPNKSESSQSPPVKTKKEKADKAVSNLKLINTTSGVRVSQACDRCRIKKIKCDGLTPCRNCEKIDFDCKTSDKLTRRAFPKGYTENLEQKLKVLQEENRQLKLNAGLPVDESSQSPPLPQMLLQPPLLQALLLQPIKTEDKEKPSTNTKSVMLTTNENNSVPINNPIDQIFNLDSKGIVIGNDNLNFESQFNHLLISLNLPFLKITNSHNFLLNDPNSYLYHPSYTMYNQFHNRDLEVIYNPITVNNYAQHNDILGEMSHLTNNELPRDVYDLFIKLIGNFKKMFNNKRELDCQIIHFFINYNTFIPLFDYKQFMESYDAFHTMYPFMFTYDDATINGYNILNNDYQVVNEYLMVVIQIYAMIMMNDPTINLNLLLNHATPNYSFSKKIKNDTTRSNDSVIRSLYDFLPYFNVFHVSINQLQTYLLFLYYSILTNNKEKSLVLSSLINSFIGILGINLNSKNLFFNDLALTLLQKRNRVKIFWAFKILLKCFNLKFGFKPSLNTTVINPVTIDRYFELTPSKLSTLLEIDSLDSSGVDELFKTLLKPSVEFLNLVNIILPSSFSPNYYQYLKNDDRSSNVENQKKSGNNKHLDWILNDDDGDGNDGNLNYNFTQFLTIDKNLSNWRYSLKEKNINLLPLASQMNLPRLSSVTSSNLYHNITINNNLGSSGISHEGLINYLNTGLPDIHTASQLIKIQLNFHYLLIRSMNYLNFVIDRELTQNYYVKISNISREVLAYFILIFEHVEQSIESWEDDSGNLNVSDPHTASSTTSNNPLINRSTGANQVIMDSLGLDVDDDGFVINDFLVKRRKPNNNIFGGGGLELPNQTNQQNQTKRMRKQIPPSPFNYMLNGLSMTIINLKKSIILQMLYLLICSLKIFKKGGLLINDSVEILSRSVELFIKIFINYHIPPSSTKFKPPTKLKEDELFVKLMSDEFKDEILKEQKKNDESDDEMDEYLVDGIDWDDEEMDEDLKYLKILKFIKYKINALKATNKKNSQRTDIPQPSEVHHHHHHHHLDTENNTKSSMSPPPTSAEHPTAPTVPSTTVGPPAPPSLMNFYGPMHPPTNASSPPAVVAGSPNSFPGMPKMPSITRFDFLLGGEDNFPNHTTSPTTFNYNNGAMGSTDHKVSEDELVKKEKLVVNDLMNLKHGHKNIFGHQWGNLSSSTATSPTATHTTQANIPPISTTKDPEP